MHEFQPAYFDRPHVLLAPWLQESVFKPLSDGAFCPFSCKIFISTQKECCLSQLFGINTAEAGLIRAHVTPAAIVSIAVLGHGSSTEGRLANSATAYKIEIDCRLSFPKLIGFYFTIGFLSNRPRSFKTKAFKSGSPAIK
jgi:hypothetical protein